MGHLVCEDDNSPLWWGSTVCSYPSSAHFPGLEYLATSMPRFWCHCHWIACSYRWPTFCASPLSSISAVLQVLQKGVVFYLRSFMSAVHGASTWAKGDWVDNPWSFFPCICMLWDVLSKGPEANLFRANSMAAKTPKAETGWRLRFLDGEIFQLVAFVSILGSASH